MAFNRGENFDEKNRARHSGGYRGRRDRYLLFGDITASVKDTTMGYENE